MTNVYSDISTVYAEIPGQFEPFETPFDKAGIPTRPSRFIYLGNRSAGRYSGLLPMDYDWASLGWGLAEYFPMGYTNLYHFEKKFAVHPDPERQARFRPDKHGNFRPYRPKGLGTKPEEGELYYVFREPISVKNPSDVIGMMFCETRAMAMAERYAFTYGRAALVGLMISKMTWH